MSMTILIASAVGMIAPCVGLWLADQRDRVRPQH
jgi:hypothetical protein